MTDSHYLEIPFYSSSDNSDANARKKTLSSPQQQQQCQQKKQLPKKIIVKKEKTKQNLQQSKMIALHKTIKSLLTNERNKCIELIHLFGDPSTGKPNRKAFQITIGANRPVIYSGLTSRLQELFWPDTPTDPRQYNDQQRNRKPLEYTPRPWRRHSKKASKCGLSGKEHGSKVHHQLDMYCKALQTQPNLKLKNFFAKGELDNCVLRLVNRMRAQGWMSVATEFEIFDESCGIATSIDGLMAKADGSLVLVELKTGYDNNDEYGPHPSDPMFPAPFDQVANCPQSQAMMQVMAMREILERKYNVKLDGACVLRILPRRNADPEVVPMPEWCLDKTNRNNLYNLLVASSKI